MLSRFGRHLRVRAVLPFQKPTSSPLQHAMSTMRSSLSHEERTSLEPRSSAKEAVILSRIEQINVTIRLLRLTPVDPGHAIKFLPGQWLDVFIPSRPKAGGFTITSTPEDASPTNGDATSRTPYLELAVQRSDNPPAQWLWRPEGEILGQRLVVRAGGSFVWPPPVGVGVGTGGEEEVVVERLVLVAGGVGIKIMDAVARAQDSGVRFRMFLTGIEEEALASATGLPADVTVGRITERDLWNALGPVEGREKTVCYVCGPPQMTDGFVGVLKRQEGMDARRVLCEKWW
ncbi:hypothetical protein M8818_006161 [Zalaria obscura]|uniref:Uncharacterized protein n=1 Tax=Zalaria obscura TaxID=2024903 RepID=A0ACC3S837_9PEZI